MSNFAILLIMQNVICMKGHTYMKGKTNNMIFDFID